MTAVTAPILGPAPTPAEPSASITVHQPALRTVANDASLTFGALGACHTASTAPLQALASVSNTGAIDAASNSTSTRMMQCTTSTTFDVYEPDSDYSVIKSFLSDVGLSRYAEIFIEHEVGFGESAFKLLNRSK
eukprot:SAG31_NODE_6158_length_2144_cov_1.501222_3_plen_134_part_00